MGQVEAAGFVVSEALFDLHTLGVLTQGLRAGVLVGNDRNPFRRVFGIAYRPCQRQVGQELTGERQLDILKAPDRTRLHAELINSTDPPTRPVGKVTIVFLVTRMRKRQPTDRHNLAQWPRSTPEAGCSGPLSWSRKPRSASSVTCLAYGLRKVATRLNSFFMRLASKVAL